MHQSFALRTNIILASAFAGTMGCEGQPTQPAPAISAEPLSAAAAPDEGNAKVEMVINAPPQVDGMSSSTGNVASNSPVMLQVTASDPDSDPLSFAWTSTCPGSFDQTDRDQVTFITGTLARDASCAFHVDVSDGHGGNAKGRWACRRWCP